MPYNWVSQLPNIVEIVPDLLDRLPIGVHVEDSDLRSVFVNVEFTKIFGYTIQEVAFPEIWWPLIYPDQDYRKLVQETWFAAVEHAKRNDTEIVPQEWRILCKGGLEKIVQFHAREANGYLVHAYIDVTARHCLEAELRDHANTDPLTRIANRRSFFSSAAAHLTTASQISVLLIDVDHFKSVNDRFGHDIGDRLLVSIAELCKNSIRDEGHLARWGGEEFAAILPGAGREEALRLAEEMRQSVAAMQLLIEGGVFSVSVSIGATSRKENEVSIDELMRRADEALYVAKTSGRNRVIFS